jgi:poly-gamma-glutamate synthesis protein (capsule biosynthesis protein)
MKRSLAAAACATLAALAHPAGLAGQRPYRAAQGKITFALTGDAIISRPVSSYTEPEFLRLVEAIRAADAAFTNLEIVLQDAAELMPMPTSGGSYMYAHPRMAHELAWMGFDMVSRANNHTFDYGIEGMRATTRAVEEAGLAQAGVGENLALAEEAGYVETANGRVALISTASTFEDFQAAGPQRRDMRGNPGLNPIRFERISVLPRPSFEALRRIADELGQGGGRQGDTLRFFGERFVVGERPAVTTRMQRRDKERITQAIAAAKRQADWVVVATHTHEGAGSREVPADFLVEYARAAIDAGADVFVGTGPHVLRGIEIYKGKPIFYSLGNFFMQNETVQLRPGAEVERYDMPKDARTVDYYDMRQERAGGYFTTDPVYWESVVALPTFEDNALKEIRLLPVTLGYQTPRSQRGRPILAGPELGRKIIERLARLSEPFGTTIRYENGIGVIRASQRVSVGRRGDGERESRDPSRM